MMEGLRSDAYFRKRVVWYEISEGRIVVVLMEIIIAMDVSREANKLISGWIYC